MPPRENLLIRAHNSGRRELHWLPVWQCIHYKLATLWTVALYPLAIVSMRLST